MPNSYPEKCLIKSISAHFLPQKEPAEPISLAKNVNITQAPRKGNNFQFSHWFLGQHSGNTSFSHTITQNVWVFFCCFLLAYNSSQECCILKEYPMLAYISVLHSNLMRTCTCTCLCTEITSLTQAVGILNTRIMLGMEKKKKKLRKKEEEKNPKHFTKEYDIPLFFFVFRRRKALCPAATPNSLVNLCLWTEFGTTGPHLTKTEPLKLAEQLENQVFQRTHVAHWTKPATTGS